MKVSVIMPMYNRESVVKEAVESILNQTMGDLELIVLDDCSTDHSVEVVESIRDSRVRLVKAPFKTNIPMLRNAGLGMAQGEYVGYMDSDDIAAPERLELECAFLDENPEYGVVSGYHRTFGKSESLVTLPLTHEEIVGALPVRCVMGNGSCLIRRELAVSVGLRPEYFVCEDYAFWVDLIGRTKFANLDQVLLHVRYWDQQTTTGSWSSPYKLTLRRSILREIHKTAFERLGVAMSEEEVSRYSYYMGDTARFNTYTESDIPAVRAIIDTVTSRLQAVHPEYVESFRESAERKIGWICELV